MPYPLPSGKMLRRQKISGVTHYYTGYDAPPYWTKYINEAKLFEKGSKELELSMELSSPFIDHVSTDVINHNGIMYYSKNKA